MAASWIQTLILAAIGAVLPFLETMVSGGTVSIKTVGAAIALAVLTAGANILRSPVWNPPTMVKGPTNPPAA